MDATTLSQKVYDSLYQRMRAGAIPPGTRLVNRKIAAELGTSTIPVREAIGRLVSEGLAESTPGGGAFVRTPEPNELAELYDVRETLEVLAAAEAARFATDRLVAELREPCELFESVAAAIAPGKHATRKLFSQWLDAEEQFHTRLIAASRNRWLVKTAQSVRVISLVFAAHRQSPNLLTHSIAEETARHHHELLEILAAKDVAAARAWMTAHIRTGRDTVLGHLRSARNSK
ncbi:MAG TPA: GntR family transcriptional regulator [Pirellulales bacterium]